MSFEWWSRDRSVRRTADRHGRPGSLTSQLDTGSERRNKKVYRGGCPESRVPRPKTFTVWLSPPPFLITKSSHNQNRPSVFTPRDDARGEREPHIRPAAYYVPVLVHLHSRSSKFQHTIHSTSDPIIGLPNFYTACYRRQQERS
jgi:hypothetical protein